MSLVGLESLVGIITLGVLSTEDKKNIYFSMLNKIITQENISFHLKALSQINRVLYRDKTDKNN